MDHSLLSRLQPAHQSLLERVAEVAAECTMSLWLVGGVVRDLLADRPVEYDVDLVVEGDAIVLAHALAAALGGRVTATYPPFGTATVELLPSPVGWSRGLHLDLAMARVETYPAPAALPVVAPATIEQDLARRDFSINAMALDVQRTAQGVGSTCLLDPYQGQRDLEGRLLRVLHDQSFNDDPTRILRGLRQAARMSLTFEPHTRMLLGRALAQQRLEATSPDRIRTELCLALDEPYPDEVLCCADRLGITEHVVAPLVWSESIARRCEQARSLERDSEQGRAENHYLLVAGLLCYDLTPAEREALIMRYRLPGDAARLLRDLEPAQSCVEHLMAADLQPSELDRLLAPLSEPTLLVLRCAEPGAVAAAIRRYQEHLRHLKPCLNGNDLQRLGIARGPQLGEMLRHLRAARLDGIVSSCEEEEAWVLCRAGGTNE